MAQNHERKFSGVERVAGAASIFTLALGLAACNGEAKAGNDTPAPAETTHSYTMGEGAPAANEPTPESSPTSVGEYSEERWNAAMELGKNWTSYEYTFNGEKYDGAESLVEAMKLNVLDFPADSSEERKRLAQAILDNVYGIINGGQTPEEYAKFETPDGPMLDEEIYGLQVANNSLYLRAAQYGIEGIDLDFGLGKYIWERANSQVNKAREAGKPVRASGELLHIYTPDITESTDVKKDGFVMTIIYYDRYDKTNEGTTDAGMQVALHLDESGNWMVDSNKSGFVNAEILEPASN